jgi:predicted ATPase/transcriptional regulator with XRE-family HTH domain
MPNPKPASLGHLLRQLRLRAALSQELAARAGISARAISDLERGQRASARFETVRLLADALDLSPEDRALLTQTAQSPMIEITLQQPLATPRSHWLLPASRPPLVGRRREVEELVCELTSGDTRLVTLTGPGGVGKTRLAMAVATGAAERFAGAVAWVDLSALLDPGAVIARIASILGVVDSTTQSPAEGLARHLADGRFLLVLDNFEQVIDAAPAISELLAMTPSLTLLVTSRAPLRVSPEIEHPVTPLALPAPDAATRDISDVEAVRLFVERARAVHHDFVLTCENSEAVARICRRLDGLPLAIELAASRSNVLSPQMLLERLEQRLPLLTRGSRDAPRRQQTMADTIAWSYNLLSPEAQKLFRRLAVFVGGFTLDTVEWLAEIDRVDDLAAIDALANLTDNNLVTRGHDSRDGMRFTMLETIREYGIAQLIECRELQEAHDQLAGYCRSLARYGDGIPSCIVPEPWVAMVDRERDNIRAAYHHLAAADDSGRIFEFATAFGHYLYNRGPIDEAWSWFERAIDPPVSEPTVRLQGLYWASHLSSHLGMTDRASCFANEALEIAHAIGDIGWRAAIVHCQAMIELLRGNKAHAEAHFNEELRLWKQAGVEGLSGFALMFLGVFAFEQGHLTRAHALEDRADEIFTGMGGIAWLALTQWYRGWFSVSEGHYTDAAMHFSQSLRLAHQQKATMIEHMGLVGLGAVASESALHETAARLIGAADRSLERTGQHLGGSIKELYDRTASTSQSLIGRAAFDEAREIGATFDHAEVMRSAETITRAAAERALDRATGDRVGNADSSPTLRPQLAAD